jgi:TonB family protein
MKKALLLLLLATPVLADDAEVAKGLQNLRTVLAAAQILEFRASTGTAPKFDQAFPDPWGTPYRIDVASGRVVSAGSDGKFDEASWTQNVQFTGYEGDVVFEKGRLVRSNRNWLYSQVTPDSASAKELEELRKAEMAYMAMRTPQMHQIAALQVSAIAMRDLSALAAEHLKTNGNFAKLQAAADPASVLVTEANANPRLLKDAWGTPLRFVVTGEHYRIISAGADRKFDESTWGRAATTDPSEDIVLEDGTFIRTADGRSLLNNASTADMLPLAQPPDPRIERDPKWRRVGGDVKAPVVVERVEPSYPEEYRKMRLGGIVILEVEVSETGEVGGVRLLKSVAPDIDTSAMDAVRRWKFTPATENGRPVPSLFNLTINFKLK